MSQSHEAAITAAWAEVFGLEKVDADANFFGLGGDSIQVAKVIRRLRETIHPDLPLRLLFMAPTIAGFSREVEQFLLTAPMPADAWETDDSEEGEL